ncbi:MAG TPA: ABC transporter permease subunit [Ilumatobacteraceae bacterium]|nr:ABC transporter permease subunit [Ilumatobacteraceae bacterium]
MRLRALWMALAGMAVLIACWEGYIALGEATDGTVLGFDLPARYDKSAMPHVWNVVTRFGDQAVAGRPGTVGSAVLAACWYTFRVSMVGLLIGVAGGMLVALVMQRWRLAEKALLPYVIISQTIPLIVLAPVLNAWSGQLSVGPIEWQRWYNLAIIAAYLAYYPVAIGALRGLQSPKEHHVELMDSMAASGTATMFKLRLPAAVPYILPALRLSAASAIVGTIVAEISIGGSGIGRLIIDYFQRSTGDATNIAAAVLGAALLGLVVAALVSAFEWTVMRNRQRDAMSEMA